MITLTAEQAQQIEEALEDIVRVFEFETGTPVEALATIRAARAQELNLNCKSVQKRLATQWGYVKADQAEQEPVGRWNWNEAKFEWLTKFDYHKHHMTPLYAAPVRTKDLTDEELNDIWYGNTKDGWLGLFRAVISADREKNE